MKKILLLLLFIPVIVWANDKYSRATIYFDGKTEIELGRVGIDLTEGNYRRGCCFTSDFSMVELEKIRAAGFRVEVLIEDVSTYYQNRNNSPKENRNASTVTCPTHEHPYTVPSHFYLGAMGGFFTYDQFLEIVDSMTLLYPNLITAKQEIDPTYTIENRPIYYLKISDNPNVNETEPEVLYTAVHHAREPESLSQLIYYMWYLLENYSTNPEVKTLVDNTQMYFVPVLNPDGYIYNQTTNPGGGGMWRKNRRDNLDGTFGVDLNRNYDFVWGYDDNGSSPSGADETFRGNFPASEPEVQAISNFVSAHQFKLALNYHTYGNHLINPWGFAPDTLTPDSVTYTTWSRSITNENHYHSGTTDQTLHYLVNGDSDSWYYGEQSIKPKTYAWTPEVGTQDDGFWPTSDRIIPLAQENMHANFTLARLAGRYGECHFPGLPYITSTNAGFHFDFQELGMDTTGAFTISITPLSSNIQSVGSPVVHSGLNFLQRIQDSIAINLSSSINGGDAVDFVLNNDNGLYTLHDTIHMIFGSPATALTEDGSSTSQWSPSTTWGITTESYTSAPSSITDSPFSTYPSNDYSIIQLANPVAIPLAADATLQFEAKWEVESMFDYVQVQASNDNGASWVALCGNYTHDGSIYQPFGEPLYDGYQLSWVHETISLNDYFGQNILIRFVIVSDGFSEYDGFYFDDLKVESVANTTGISSVQGVAFVSSAYPNPSTGISKVVYANLPKGCVAELMNVEGKTCFTEELGVTGELNLSVNDLSAGMYFLSVKNGAGERISGQRVVVEGVSHGNH